jgi:signal transduction histidine kinase
MRDKKKYDLFIKTLVLYVSLIVIIVGASVGLFYYVFSIPEPQGISIADWPQRFTSNFSLWTSFEDGKIKVSRSGLDRLDEYGLWVQFLDEDGNEIFSHNKPDAYPSKYSVSELFALTKDGYRNGYTVFAGTVEDNKKISYLMGFPYDIGNYQLWYNGQRVGRLSPVAAVIAAAGLVLLAGVLLAYSVWLSRRLAKVTKGIGELSDRKYRKISEKGSFGTVFEALNKVDDDLRHADELKEETDAARRDWIANITHDLKTPLSPVKGYAELLADGSSLSQDDVREYGRIILKNTDHAERLINDLKLTYQLDSGSVPCNLQTVSLTRLVKEWVIDIINDPAFSSRDISFEGDEDIRCSIDPSLMQRAVSNIIINALTHNTPDTKVTIKTAHKEEILITVSDNGAGIDEKELNDLFNRYYRGTATNKKPEGSGLGLAIAKQIVTLHGGDINVKTKIGEGTDFIISLPAADPQN